MVSISTQKCKVLVSDISHYWEIDYGSVIQMEIMGNNMEISDERDKWGLKSSSSLELHMLWHAAMHILDHQALINSSNQQIVSWAQSSSRAGVVMIQDM